jgi:hypothetical protein
MLRIDDRGLEDRTHRRAPEANARNEPNLACPQGKMRKTKPNLGGVGHMGKGWRRAGRGSPGVKRAKRTQFGLPAGHMRKTKPNLQGLGYVGKGRRRVGLGSGGE